MTTPLQIQQRPPIRGGLASVSAPLEGVDWRGGVEITMTPDGDVFVVEVCSGTIYGIDGSVLPDKPIDSPAGGAKFFPVTIEKIVQCGPGATQTTVGDIARQIARGSLDRQTYKVLARVLQGIIPTVSSTSGESGTSLANHTNVPDGFDANNPGTIKGTLQGLLDHVCECWNSDPVFHIPRAWMPHFLGDVVRWDEATETFRFGPHLVSFDCYENVDPTNTYATLNDGTEVWIYATPMPMVAISDEDDVRVLEHRQNNYKALVERHAIIAFDTTCNSIKAKATVA